METKAITWHTYPTFDRANADHLELATLVKGSTYAMTYPSEPVAVKACELARAVGGGLTVSLTLNKKFRWWTKGVVPDASAIEGQFIDLREHLRRVIYPQLEIIGVSVDTFVVEAEWAAGIGGQSGEIAVVHDAFDKFLRAAFPRADIMWLLNNGRQGELYKINNGDYAVGTLYNIDSLDDTRKELSATRTWADHHGLKLAVWVGCNFQKSRPRPGHVYHSPRGLRIVGNMCREYGVDIVGLYAHAANWPPGYLDAVSAFLEGLGR